MSRRNGNSPTAQARLKKKKAKSNVPMIVGVALGAVTLLVGVTLAVMFWPSGKKTEAVAANTGSRSSSAAMPGGGGGSTVFRGPAGVPGQLRPLPLRRRRGGWPRRAGPQPPATSPTRARTRRTPSIGSWPSSASTQSAARICPRFKEDGSTTATCGCLAEYLASLK